MEHFDLVEKLVNTFGVSYEEAKDALEASNWDPVEAAVILERGKNGSTDESKAEEQPNVNKGTKGYTYNIPVDDIKNAGSNFFKTIWDFLNLNTFVVKKSSGEVFLDIPIWLAVLLVCAFFWPVILIMGIVFVMGYRFSFNGPQLGKKSVKNTVENVEKATEDFVNKVKNTVAPDTCEKVEEQVIEEQPVEENKEKEKSEDNSAENGEENSEEKQQ